MSKTSKTASSLRLVVVGQGETRGRRPHLLRLRESLVRDLHQVADGQMYLLVEVALRRFIDDLQSKPKGGGVEIVQYSPALAPGPEDDHLLDQWKSVRAGAARAAASVKKRQD